MTRRTAQLDRRALFSSAAAAALLAASGVSAAGVPKSGGRLRLALSGGARSDSWTAGQGLFMQVARQGLVFDTLTEVAADGSLRPELATEWQARDDARVWTFDLRPEVKFHDGAPLTAQDVAQSLVHFIDGTVEATAPLRVEIRLNDPDAGLPLRLAGPDYVIRPAHAPIAGIGTGLYQVKQFLPGRQLLTHRVSHHFKDGQAGWFDEVELTSIPSQRVRVQALGEYMVDAADVGPSPALQGLHDVAVLPNLRRPVLVLSQDIARPADVSNLRPMDNLRAAERWWFA